MRSGLGTAGAVARALSPWFCSSSAFCSRRSSFLTDLMVALPCSMTTSESSADSSLRFSSCRDREWERTTSAGGEALHSQTLTRGAENVSEGFWRARGRGPYLALVPHLLALLVDL